MCALYKLTALVALALSCRAQLTPEECAPLSDTLPASEMDKIYGQWVLVAAFADFEAGVEMIGNISTSHLDLSLNADTQGVHYHEMNKDLNGVCVGRISEATVVDRDSTALTLHIADFVREQDGVQTKHNASADVVFYRTCPDSLVRIYRATFFGPEARILFFHRREGKHLDLEELTAYINMHRYINKQAECLQFKLNRHYMYDGKSEVCTNKVSEEKPAEA